MPRLPRGATTARAAPATAKFSKRSDGTKRTSRRPIQPCSILKFWRVLPRVSAKNSTYRSPPTEADGFGHSLADWPVFPDTADALRYLKQHFKLVILSNVDRESFKASNEKLGVDFDAVYTAQDIGSYKPDPRNFAYMIDELAELGFSKGDILHVAESLFHDHAPAKAADLATAWIHRRHPQTGHGATARPDGDVVPDARFESLAAFADAHRGEGPRRSA